jgi:hypothetical protein
MYILYVRDPDEGDDGKDDDKDEDEDEDDEDEDEEINSPWRSMGLNCGFSTRNNDKLY